ncbi:probable glucan 1,3-beta-glucosidase A isoform X2 [Actinidia eriantha]|uniref:probable glucan 1,3-beta-glucosidase A isoform X2 n=1 Tax=Actinidia eriantha TaxID=165200 RepID=UPI0025835730|nr:probable glucan 1,3-beta-glucosidase A isoform X2 [Actinidia eriantha]
MELVLGKWVFGFLLSCWLIFTVSCSVEGIHGDSKVRAVNLGGWLVVEGWIKPSLFDGIPNGDMIDGTEVQFKSVTLQKYVSAEEGGGMNVTVDRDIPSSWETFRASIGNQLTADYPGTPAWDDNAATFEMTIVANNLHGDYQLANGYGHDKAKDILKTHRNSFITVEDFDFLYRHGINAVRIPVGWWIAYDPNPPAPFIGGSLEPLDNAFSWAQAYNIKCIIDLHAAPGSQNGMEHSASRDGSTGWPMSPDYISQTLTVIEFLASRYAKHPALLGIELLNEPSAAGIPLDLLVSYYKQGYQIVRKHSSTAYVIVCQRIGNADPLELYQANIGFTNIVLDLHYYNLFDTFFVNMSTVDNIKFIYNSRETQLQALNSANGPLVFIGEWVNEWNVKNGSQKDYQGFGRAQLEVYNAASFGWSYWTLKNDRKHWDFEWNIRNDFLQLGRSPDVKISNILALLGTTCICFFLHGIL